MAVTDVHGTRTPALGTFTVTIASPAVFSKTGHQLGVGDKVTFSTTGALPTGLTAGTTYYVISAGLAADAFEVSTTDGGSAVNTTGSQSGTHSMIAETILADTTAVGTYILEVDRNAMAAGDVLELRLYKMTLTGGTRRVVAMVSYYGVPPTDDVIVRSMPISTPLTDSGAVRATLKQLFGTARAFPWSLEKYA